MGTNKRTVYAGTCFQNDKLVCGVVEENNESLCDEGTWEPPHVVAHKGHPNRSCAYYPDRMVIGRCDGPNGPCSNLASRCIDPSSFVVRDPDCRITQDYKYYENENINENSNNEINIHIDGVGIKYTTYGKCGDRCVWSPDDCLEGEEYINNDMECTANKVKLGACLDGYGYCTVSPTTCVNVDGSQTAEPYYTHDDFLEKFNTNCYLADLPDPPAPPTPPTFAPIPATIALPTTTTTTNSIPISSSSNYANSIGGGGTSSTQSSSSLSQNSMIAIVIVVALPLGVALGFIVAKLHSKKELEAAAIAAKQQRQVECDSPPITILGINSGENIVDADEELSLA